MVSIKGKIPFEMGDDLGELYFWETTKFGWFINLRTGGLLLSVPECSFSCLMAVFLESLM